MGAAVARGHRAAACPRSWLLYFVRVSLAAAREHLTPLAPGAFQRSLETAPALPVPRCHVCVSDSGEQCGWDAGQRTTHRPALAWRRVLGLARTWADDDDDAQAILSLAVCRGGSMCKQETATMSSRRGGLPNSCAQMLSPEMLLAPPLCFGLLALLSTRVQICALHVAARRLGASLTICHSDLSLTICSDPSSPRASSVRGAGSQCNSCKRRQCGRLARPVRGRGLPCHCWGSPLERGRPPSGATGRFIRS